MVNRKNGKSIPDTRRIAEPDLLICFRWSFFAEKTPRLKIRMDADFKPVPDTAPPERG